MGDCVLAYFGHLKRTQDESADDPTPDRLLGLVLTQAQFTSDLIQPGQTALLEVQTRKNRGTGTMRLTLTPGNKMSIDFIRP
jgi:hypothetical protein